MRRFLYSRILKNRLFYSIVVIIKINDCCFFCFVCWISKNFKENFFGNQILWNQVSERERERVEKNENPVCFL